MRFGDLTFLELREKAAAGWLALIPTGCTEQQGPHLPVDFDSWFAEALMLAAADRATQQYGVHALVLPALPFGPTPEHRAFGSGFIDLPLAVHHAAIRAILDSLRAQGFQRLVVWRGCGGHHLGEVVAQFNENARGTARAWEPNWPYQASWCSVADPNVPGGHADSFTTALSMHLRPASVRHELIADPHSRPVDWSDPQLDFAAYSTSGVIGDPTAATAELGERLWADLVGVTAEMLVDIAQAPVDTGTTGTAPSPHSES